MLIIPKRLSSIDFHLCSVSAKLNMFAIRCQKNFLKFYTM